MVYNYSSEKNIQIVISLLKSHNIKKVIVSPGATNFSFVGSLQSDPWFEIYSSVDERSAAYMACGMAAESGEPVALSCTGSTASRDYYPGLTEAYHRKLPVLAITSHQGADRIGQLIPQNIDRRQIPHDIARFAVELPIIKDERDESFAVRECNRAILELFRNGGGPVHINLITTYSRDFSVKELPPYRVIKRFFAWDKLPEIPKGKIVVFVGTHRTFTETQTKAVDAFCECYDAVVVCDHTSGYYGKYKICPAIALQQFLIDKKPWVSDLAIHIGEVSAAEYAWNFPTNMTWRVSEDGEIRDPYSKLANVFQMPEEFFFTYYVKDRKGVSHNQYDSMKSAIDAIYDQLPDLPFSNIWNVSQFSRRIPSGSLLHISSSNTRRCWNMFPLPNGVESAANVGCCGIDGCTSSLLGASIVSPNRLCYLVTGDLAFFYDLNSLGNRHVGKNVRILLVNNGIGAEFKLKTNNCYAFGDDANKFMAAGGHFGNKSPLLVRHFAEDLGFKYYSATTKEEYLHVLDEFVNPVIGDKPIIFEIFTSHENENEAMLKMKNIIVDPSQKFIEVIDSFKEKTKKVLGEKLSDHVRSLFK